MPALPQVKTPQQELAESFDRLVYLVKTTAPHLQMYTDELRARIKTALASQPAQAASVVSPAPAPAAKAPLIPPPR